jgi:hypothetical protein
MDRRTASRPPTRGAIERILHYIGRDPGEIIGIIPPRNGVAVFAPRARGKRSSPNCKPKRSAPSMHPK